MKRVTVNLTEQTGASLKAQAAKSKRSMASEAAVAIEDHLQRTSTKPTKHLPKSKP